MADFLSPFDRGQCSLALYPGATLPPHSRHTHFYLSRHQTAAAAAAASATPSLSPVRALNNRPPFGVNSIRTSATCGLESIDTCRRGRERGRERQSTVATGCCLVGSACSVGFSCRMKNEKHTDTQIAIIHQFSLPILPSHSLAGLIDWKKQMKIGEGRRGDWLSVWSVAGLRDRNYDHDINRTERWCLCMCVCVCVCLLCGIETMRFVFVKHTHSKINRFRSREGFNPLAPSLPSIGFDLS